MIEEEGKCKAEAEARGLPEETRGRGIGHSNGKREEEEECQYRNETKRENSVRLKSFHSFTIQKNLQ